MRKIKELSTEETELLLTWLGSVKQAQPAAAQAAVEAPANEAPARAARHGASKVLYHPRYFTAKANVRINREAELLEKTFKAPSPAAGPWHFSFRAGGYRIRLQSVAPYVTLFYRRKRAS